MRFWPLIFYLQLLFTVHMPLAIEASFSDQLMRQQPRNWQHTSSIALSEARRTWVGSIPKTEDSRARLPHATCAVFPSRVSSCHHSPFQLCNTWIFIPAFPEHAGRALRMGLHEPGPPSVVARQAAGHYPAIQAAAFLQAHSLQGGISECSDRGSPVICLCT